MQLANDSVGRPQEFCVHFNLRNTLPALMGGGGMTQYLLSLSIFLALNLAASGQSKYAGPPPPSPREVVERLWAIAATGDLLTSEGWNRASGLFTVPRPRPTGTPILVVSNYYGINSDETKGSTAHIQMEYVDCGQIDSVLRYTPPQKTKAAKTSFGYHLVSVPTYVAMYGSDGKTVVEKKPTGATAWQIEGPQTDGPPPLPWTTVNTAIRYVLEMRDRAADPVIKKNANETLPKLMKLH